MSSFSLKSAPWLHHYPACGFSGPLELMSILARDRGVSSCGDQVNCGWGCGDTHRWDSHNGNGAGSPDEWPVLTTLRVCGNLHSAPLGSPFPGPQAWHWQGRTVLKPESGWTPLFRLPRLYGLLDSNTWTLLLFFLAPEPEEPFPLSCHIEDCDRSVSRELHRLSKRAQTLETPLSSLLFGGLWKQFKMGGTCRRLFCYGNEKISKTRIRLGHQVASLVKSLRCPDI